MANTIKTIKSADGDVIDCVNILKQPAFDHPLLQNHTIQMRPSSYPKRIEAKDNVRKLQQPWHLNGRCPEGTVPIHRTQKSDKKYPKGVTRPQSDSEVTKGHEYAIAWADYDKYMGGKAEINIWNPRVQAGGDFSVSQIWLMSKNIQTSIEVGWIADGYVNTGCYNLQCSGFVQVNHAIALGGTVTPISVFDGPQYKMTVSIFKASMKTNDEDLAS
ncbi:hypothetical protein QJS04_geneDACA010454 [Acorus gramineus]|uniref:Neprosin PEP catalytic domain-containing protein n=1 Tax=Acorus gramineus TaxID=55184 RepID=A0AAV9ALC7_ACOGR|nr:hypothetical protein QJS04_geneDACA010454 [Acorus gramineus]